MYTVKRLASLAGIALISAALASCAGTATNVKSDMAMTPETKSIEFEAVKAPETDAEKREILASPSVTINGDKHSIGYHTILRSGESPKGDRRNGIYGEMFDKFGKTIYNADGSRFISVSNDFASLLKGEDGKLYMVSHFENSPGGMYVTELNQNSSTGMLTAERTRHIDFSEFNGGWVHCAGSVTPWGTHLGSEEYEPDARKVDPVTGHFNDDYNFDQTKYFGLNAKDMRPGAFKNMNVYDYGWQIEVSVDSFHSVKSEKHYSMGRVAHELAYVMPNKKTAYISDDGTNVGLFRFEADAPGDLSSGTLYAAKWNQTRAAGGGAADLGWISLGHATDADIKHYLDMKVTFSDIFETESPVNDTCPTDGFKIVNTTMGKECLEAKTGYGQSSLQTRNTAIRTMMGGTTEFRKMEGITLDPDTMTMYLAMSEVARGMENFKKNGKASSSYDGGGYNDIKLLYNACGIVYGLDLDDNYKAENMYAVVQGIPVSESYGAMNDDKMYPAGSPFEKNKCSLEGIANPDNVTFIPGYDTLIIGEDTGGGHQNDVIWSYNVKSGKMTRIQTTPYGSETTSPYFYPDVNGWAYLMSVVQHPYGESDEDKTAPGSEATMGYTGYVGPFPAMK